MWTHAEGGASSCGLEAEDALAGQPSPAGPIPAQPGLARTSVLFLRRRLLAESGAWRAAACAGALAAALLAAAPPPQAAYLDGPPPAHAGGFGEDTCHACHFENDLDAPGGSLTISGLPATFDPSGTYHITVSLERAGMGRAGFQLAARIGDGDGAGGPAGALQGLDGDARVQAALAPDGVAYAQHTEPGTVLTGPDSTSWTVEWRPADVDATAVVFHAAANAANDDASEFGDFIYTASATSRSAGP